jgi:Winged helix DNA-binding domain
VPDVLTTRQLNRATLARQFLLERVDKPAYDVIELFVGLQAQERRDPYIGLWSRINDFDPGELETLLLDRKVVRLVVQRGTVHAITADDCLVLRPLAQPILTQQLYTHRDFGPLLKDVDLDPPMEYAREVLAEQPRNARQLREAFTAKFPEHDAAALTFACRNLLPFIQVPPRGLWSRSGEVVGTTAEAWLGRPVHPDPSVDEVMLRYVAAFGPATVRDAATWSRYTGLREVFDRLRPQLRTFRDDNGREYFDVPDGPLPDPDTPAPVRLLPQFDNVLLSHADRSRFVGEQARSMTSIWYDQLGFVGSLLVDGMLAGTWRIDEPKRTKQSGDGATMMTVTCLPSLPMGIDTDVADEAERLLALVAPNGPRELRFTSIT